ncbi:MAG: cytochrome c3 family protein [Acidobacteriota bacterium]
MNKITRTLLVLAIALAVGSSAMAFTGTYVPGSGINGTPHDLGTAHNGMNYTAVPPDPVGGRICIFCHAPHNTYRLSQANGGPPPNIGAGPQAIDEFTYLPLWNHTLPTTVSAYVMYQNGPGAPKTGPRALNAILGAAPNNVSLLCLSCHDGTIAVNSYGNVDQPASSQSTGTTMIDPSYVIGKDHYLGNHHPISFDYDAVYGADDQIRDPDVAQLTPTTTVRDHLFGLPGVPGTNVSLECASCHSVHNKGNAGEMLLWRSDQNSELCLTCHDKGIYTTP